VREPARVVEELLAWVIATGAFNITDRTKDEQYGELGAVTIE
jgi:hypothetical protein